ncbi:MAG: chromosome condensation regulator RCC1 [Chloroflexi bacterium]|nr:chromosome condensation regulator RCC1 [Chloroflexota bacterium]
MNARRLLLLLLASTVGALIVVTLVWPKLDSASASSVVAISAGGRHTCALTSAGGVMCWGRNHRGQLGTGTTEDSTTAVGVSGLDSGALSISAGFDHTCVVTTAGQARCWGENDDGQLGNGAVGDSHRTTPVEVCASAKCGAPLSEVASIAAGASHSCVLTTSGGAKCWGSNEHGQLGDGTMTDRAAPVDVPGLENLVAISAGGFHTCAITQEGAATCWGKNLEGQVGDDRACGIDCPTPSPVSGLDSGVVAITAAGLHTCALTEQGAVHCWGFNFDGQVGDGTSQNIRRAPVAVSGLDTGVVAVSANGEFRGHACAVTSAGSLLCWGDNANGQLGDGTTTDRHAPVEVTELDSVSVVEAGDAHTCAIGTSSTVVCWGHNGSGQLGDGTTVERHVPVVVPGIVALTGDATCDGSVDSIDAAVVLQLDAGLLSSLACQDAADVNNDGAINAIDAALILQFVAGLLGSL